MYGARGFPTPHRGLSEPFLQVAGSQYGSIGPGQMPDSSLGQGIAGSSPAVRAGSGALVCLVISEKQPAKGQSAATLSSGPTMRSTRC